MTITSEELQLTTAEDQQLPDSRYNINAEENGFSDRVVSYSAMYITMFQQLSNLHANERDAAARAYFYNSMSHFIELFRDDAVYFNNCRDIENYVTALEISPDESAEQMYRLHVSEFVAMLGRNHILPKSHVRHVIIPPWEVPKTRPITE